MDTNQILKLAISYEENCKIDLIKIARIKKMRNGKYQILSEKGKNLGIYNTKGDAVRRLREIEFFKHEDENNVKDQFIDLTNASDFSYSAIMREMRQKANKDQVRQFLMIFKKEFDNAVKKKNQKPEKVALQNSLIIFNKKHKIKLKKKIVKNAAITELGDPALVGKYLADIVKFTINNIPLEKRHHTLDGLRKKFYGFNADEISKKNLPLTSSIGQSIAFVKNVLFNHDAPYIREVLNNLVRNL